VLKVAVTDCAAFIVIVQEPLPEQEAPLQPTKVEPAAAEAVSATDVPAVNALLQFAPQEIPAGLETTVPDPVPVLPTESTNEVGPLPPPRYTVTKSESVFPLGQASVQTPLYL
jgi:hypothetical protein